MYCHYHFFNSNSILDTLANIAQIATAVVAFLALNTWKEKMKGGGKYEVAKNLLIGTKKLLEMIQKSVRSPSLHPKEAGKEHTDKNYQYFVYEKRLKDLYDFKRDNFDGFAVEAEVLLGSQIKEKIQKFNNKINELRTFIYLGYGILSGDSVTDEDLWGKMREKIHENRELLWNTQLEDDNYSKDLYKIVEEIEEELNKYIS